MRVTAWCIHYHQLLSVSAVDRQCHLCQLVIVRQWWNHRGIHEEGGAKVHTQILLNAQPNQITPHAPVLSRDMVSSRYLSVYPLTRHNDQ